MLALRVEQDRRGLDEVDRLQREATTIQQGWQSGRPALHKQRINIKEKISQWESRSQQSSSQDAGFKVHPPLVSRTLSGDLLGNDGSNKTYGVGNHARDSRARAKSTELDFREPPAHNVHNVAGRKSEPLKKFPTPFSTASPGKNSTTQTFASSELEVDTFSSAEPVFSAHVDSKVDCIPDILIVSKPQPPSAGDQEDNMPAGNFYTSRGFWRKLEGDRLLWENGRSNAGESRPPPKPLRTFQYRVTHNMKHAVHLDSGSPQNNNHSNLRSRRVVKPPNFPPPPCPVIIFIGMYKHRPAYITTGRQNCTSCEGSKDYPYEDVKLSTMCLPAKPPVPKKLQNQQHLVTRAVRKFTGLRRHPDLKRVRFIYSETFSFVLTGEDGSRWFCYCRKILILEEVERRREISPALVYPFMRSVMEAPFPAPGRTVTVKSFLPGSGNEVLTLCRPVDSRLEHVDFDSLLQCLTVGKLLQVFASLLLERRVIFVADKLR
ncbi:hypothetical protein XENOCAPTIV_020329 [Xenoophorus captivus]|uniref:UDENN domain-containing protein n=1 Tax=Xenoophorus captivus TaxID=1517983 RepID=A0ABV0QKL3_9TELE